MIYTVNHSPLYCYTGGKAFDPAQPTAVFIHGVAGDHSVWALQSRSLAHHGWNVLAIDLPGHGRSGGHAPESVQEAAQAVCALLDAVGAHKAALIGHSWGSLIALQAAAQLGARASHLVLVGSAYPMRVSPALLDSALNTPEKALHTMNVFSRSTLAPPSGAGVWVYGAGMALGRRVLRSNPHTNVLHRGFSACDSYDQGLEAMASTTCPVLFVLGSQDQMTPPKAAQALQQAAQARSHSAAVQTCILPVGHQQMSEAPEGTLRAIRSFLNSHPSH